ncbi:MAG: prolipoprotein diacylglyceryl transferase [Clostridia bacterium]|nr:prolipoprotein diacylglyceryl transferase [Clostridia bacterium]
MTNLLRVNRIWFKNFGWDEFEINTVAIKIGKFEVAWYGLIIMIGIFSAIFYVWRRFKENGMSTDDLIDLAFFTVLSGIVGARLYYVIFEFDSYLVTGEANFFANLWETLKNIVAIWNGGLGIYGGIIAGGLAASLVAKHKKINILTILDFLAPAVMLAQAIGRWGNFFNAEAHGGATELPWAMGILEGGSWSFYHPTFLYESLWNVVGFLTIWLVLVRIPKTKKLHKFHGQIFYTYLIWYGLGRFWIEGLRTDSLYLIPDVIRVSQLVAFLSVVIGAALMAYSFVMLNKNKENILVKRVKNEISKEKVEKDGATN